MNKADKIYLGKLLVDYSDAIEKTGNNIKNTTEMEKIMIEGFGITDGRAEEVAQYKKKLEKLYVFAESKGMSRYELMECGETYKRLSISEYFQLKSQITIEDELNQFIK